MSKPFSVEYTNPAGERIFEKPRLMITANGKWKSLMLGEDTVLVTVPYAEDDMVMWTMAKQAITWPGQTWPGQIGIVLICG